ncbi:MAG: hypothetical protein Q9227_002296 [Pyrenula ochraceoflavens]
MSYSSSSSDSAPDEDTRPSIIDLTPTDEHTSSTQPFPLAHKLSASDSVLVVEVDDFNLYAGLNTGEISVWSLATARQIYVWQAHEEAVLALCFTNHKTQLFSAGSDSTLNVWSTGGDLELLYSIKSDPGVGDIFAIAWSEVRKTVYCGAQDHSLLWYCLGNENEESLQKSSPVRKKSRHKFFDSEELGGQLGEEKQWKSIGRRAKHQRWFGQSDIKRFAHSGAIQSLLLLKEKDGTTATGSELLVTGGSDGWVKLWDLGPFTGSALGIRCSSKLPKSRQPIWCMASSGDMLYCGLGSGYVNVFNLHSKQLVFPLYIGQGDIMALRMVGGSVLCGTSTGLVRVS